MGSLGCQGLADFKGEKDSDKTGRVVPVQFVRRENQNPSSEEAYWHLVQTKSSPFFGTALYSGALLGGAASTTASQIKRFGHLYGEIIQIHDDLNDVMAVPANPDWVLGRSPLPILFAQIVDHPDKERFQALRQAIPDPIALTEAQTILIRCGAVSYCIHHLLARYQVARQLLAEASLTQREGLEGLLETVIEPVKRLLKEIGTNQMDDQAQILEGTIRNIM
jgi:geranylgeranyl pyrophosphate synthase